MKKHRTRLELTLGLVVALASLTFGGCETPAPIHPIDKAQSAFAAGQWGESIAACTEAISENPGDVRPYVLRGRAFRRLGQFQPAITDFTVAIQLMPKDPENYYLRAGVFRDQNEIDLADEDDRAGQKLDPSYQQAYLYAPPGVEIDAVAAELIRALRENDTAYNDESSPAAKELYKKPALQSDSILGGEAKIGIDLQSPSPATLSLDKERDAHPFLPEEPAEDESAGGQVSRPPVMVNPLRPSEGLLGISSGGFGSAAADVPAGPPATRRPSARRNPLTANSDRPTPGPPAEGEERAARQGRTQRGHANANPGYYPPQRSLTPYGVADTRSTGVQTDQGDEEASGSRGQSRGAGGQHGSARGGRGNGGYAGPIDPYGGYTGSAKPIGGPRYNPYGGGGPYGAGALNPYGGAGGQGSASRGRGASSGGADSDRGGSGGAAPPNPFGPYPTAPVPYVPPPGLRFN